jgi:hypothetical protein
MLKKNILKWVLPLLPGLLVAVLPAQSVDFEHYQPLSSKGPIPKDFITPSSAKYKDALKKISQKDSRSEKKAISSSMICCAAGMCCSTTR